MSIFVDCPVCYDHFHCERESKAICKGCKTELFVNSEEDFRITKKKWYIEYTGQFFTLTFILGVIAWVSATYFNDVFAIKFFHYSFYGSGVCSLGIYTYKHFCIGSVKDKEGEIILFRLEPWRFIKEIAFSFGAFVFSAVYVSKVALGNWEPFVLRF